RGVLAEAADDPDVGRAPATIVLTGILWRSAWKYRERAYRHLHWDGGMMVAHVLAAARAADLPAALFAAFLDEPVDRLVGADGIHEAVLALLRLGGPGAPALGSRAGAIAPLPFTPPPLSPAPIDYPQALRYHLPPHPRGRERGRAIRRAACGRRPPPASLGRRATPRPRQG